MPLFQLRKTQRYDVSRKSDCIQTVQLLDDTQIECTLTVESTGRECLENVLQRIGVAQAGYFGLRYESKDAAGSSSGAGPSWRWVDMDKPLRKQLQKRAASTSVGTVVSHVGGHGSGGVGSASGSAGHVVVCLGIQHYPLHAHAIAHDVTRYQLFLQLRNDVAENRLTSSFEQAVQMACYCLQAEFGDYDYARQNAEYAREIESFGGTFLTRFYTANAQQQQSFLLDVGPHIVDCHMNLAGMAAEVAEQKYIKMAEQLDGYGLEYFKVKSEQGADAFFGGAPSGVVVRRPDGHVLHYFRWSDIANLTHGKKQLCIEVSSKKKTTTKLIVEDPSLAKYLWKVTTLRRQFYLRDESTSATSSLKRTAQDGAIGPMPDIQLSTLPVDNHVIHESAIDVEFHRGTPGINGSEAMLQPMLRNEDAVDGLPRYGFPSVSQPVPMPVAIPAGMAPLPAAPGPAASLATLNQNTSVVVSGAAYSPPTPSASRSAVASALPVYRPTPDYETVMRQKLLAQPQGVASLQQQQQQQQSQSAPSPVPPPPASQQAQQMQQHHRPPPSPVPVGAAARQRVTAVATATAAAPSPVSKYINNRFAKMSALSASQPDVYAPFSANGASAVAGHAEPLYANISDYATDSRQRRSVNRSSSLIVHATYSQPDVSMVVGNHTDAAGSAKPLPVLAVSAAAGLTPGHPDDISQMLLRDYRPPPAYGDKFRSTPDLTSHIIVPGSASRVTIGGGSGPGLQVSPDLVSRRYRTGAGAAATVGVAAVAIPASAAPAAAAASSIGAANNKTAANAATFIPNMSQKQYKSFDNLACIDDDDGGGGSLSPGRRSVASGSAGGRRRASQTSNDTFHEVDSDDGGRSDDEEEEEEEEYVNDVARMRSSSGGISRDRGSFAVNSMAVATASFPGNGTAAGHHVHSAGTAATSTAAVAQTGLVATPAVNRELTSPLLRAGHHHLLVPEKHMAAAVPTGVGDPSVMIGGGFSSISAGGGFSSISAAAGGGSSAVGPRPSFGSGAAATHGEPAVLREDRIPKDERRRLLEEKLAEKAVFAEYDSVPKKRAKSDCRVALQPDCSPLNRFPNVLPYEDTRVQLTPRRERNKLGYINASHITVKVGGGGGPYSGPGEECSYIATQNPQDNTRDDFWQMVWEHNVRVITMASGLEELGQMKCARYWPQEAGPKAAIAFDEVLVTLKCSNASPCFVTHCFKVKHTSTGQSRSVWHIQYTDWPESGCPENLRGFLAYLDEINSVRLLVQAEANAPRAPLVVHCSAGVARTGVVILCDIMKKCLEYNQHVSVPDVLSQLRQQRMYMVQTSAQYVFCYRVLIEYLRGSRLI